MRSVLAGGKLDLVEAIGALRRGGHILLHDLPTPKGGGAEFLSINTKHPDAKVYGMDFRIFLNLPPPCTDLCADWSIPLSCGCSTHTMHPGRGGGRVQHLPNTS